VELYFSLGVVKTSGSACTQYKHLFYVVWKELEWTKSQIVGEKLNVQRCSGSNSVFVEFGWYFRRTRKANLLTTKHRAKLAEAKLH
jgi:hypothetical protein